MDNKIKQDYFSILSRYIPYGIKIRIYKEQYPYPKIQKVVGFQLGDAISTIYTDYDEIHIAYNDNQEKLPKILLRRLSDLTWDEIKEQMTDEFRNKNPFELTEWFIKHHFILGLMDEYKSNFIEEVELSYSIPRLYDDLNEENIDLSAEDYYKSFNMSVDD